MLSISKTMKDELSLFSISMNHSITNDTDDVSFYWFTDVRDWTVLLILSSITLLTLMDFEGLIKWHEIFSKFSLWSLIVMYASVSCILCILSEIGNFSRIFFEVRLMLNRFLRVNFLQVLAMSSFNNFFNFFSYKIKCFYIYLQKQRLCYCFLFVRYHFSTVPEPHY